MILGHAVSMNTEEMCARGSTTISLRKSDGTTLFCSSMEPTWTGNPGVCSPTPKTTACLQGYVPKNSLGSWHAMEPTKSRHDFAGQCSDVWAEANWPCSSIAAISGEGKGAKDRQGEGLLLPEPVPFDVKPVLRCKSCRVWCSGSTQSWDRSRSPASWPKCLEKKQHTIHSCERVREPGQVICVFSTLVICWVGMCLTFKCFPELEP